MFANNSAYKAYAYYMYTSKSQITLHTIYTAIPNNDAELYCICMVQLNAHV